VCPLKPCLWHKLADPWCKRYTLAFFFKKSIDRISNFWFQVYFTPSSGYYFTFPSRYFSLSLLQCFWRSRMDPRYSMCLRITCTFYHFLSFSPTGLSPFLFCFPTNLELFLKVVDASIPRFRSPLLPGSRLIFLYKLLRCFSSLAFFVFRFL